MKGQGVPRLGRRSHGDQVVTVHVETPRRLNKKTRKLLQDLAAEEGASVRSGQSLFDRVREILG